MRTSSALVPKYNTASSCCSIGSTAHSLAGSGFMAPSTNCIRGRLGKRRAISRRPSDVPRTAANAGRGHDFASGNAPVSSSAEGPHREHPRRSRALEQTDDGLRPPVIHEEVRGHLPALEVQMAIHDQGATLFREHLRLNERRRETVSLRQPLEVVLARLHLGPVNRRVAEEDTHAPVGRPRAVDLPHQPEPFDVRGDLVGDRGIQPRLGQRRFVDRLAVDIVIHERLIAGVANFDDDVVDQIGESWIGDQLANERLPGRAAMRIADGDELIRPQRADDAVERGCWRRRGRRRLSGKQHRDDNGQRSHMNP